MSILFTKEETENNVFAKVPESKQFDEQLIDYAKNLIFHNYPWKVNELEKDLLWKKMKEKFWHV